jgi:hypothetical protein
MAIKFVVEVNVGFGGALPAERFFKPLHRAACNQSSSGGKRSERGILLKRSFFAHRA